MIGTRARVRGLPGRGLPTDPPRRVRRVLIPALLLLLLAPLWARAREGGDVPVAAGPGPTTTIVPTTVPAPAAVAVPSAAPAGTPYPVVSLPDPGPCPQQARPELLVLVQDDSGSTTQSDSGARRYPEGVQLIDWIARHRCHEDDSVGVVHFARTFSAAGPFDVRTGLGDLRAALAGPDPSVGADATVLGPAVERAAQMARERPGHRPTLVIASDGQLNDVDAGRAAVRAFPGPVYVVALGGPLPTYWSSVSLAGVEQLGQGGAVGDVADRLAAIWMATRSRR